MAQKSESRDLEKVIVRLPDGMRDRLKEAAKKSGRSMNQEIVERLEASFRPLGWLPEDLTARMWRAAQRSGYTLEAEVMFALLKAYPAPASLDGILFEIRNMISILKQGAGIDGLNLLTDDLYALVGDIADGRVKVDDGQAAERVREMLHRYEAHGGQPGWENTPAEDAWKDEE